MHHWSVDTKKFKKENPKEFAIWRLEQLVNFGLQGEKINQSELKKNWSKLKLDPKKKSFLKLLLWPRKRS
jgi:hypothetical protein